jgi:uncharacterized membrane protein (UPF0182 family)
MVAMYTLMLWADMPIDVIIWIFGGLVASLMVVSSIVLAGVFPWVVQSFQVVPNERTLEAPFIKRNLDATKKAYGLDKIEMVEYKAKTDTDVTALRADGPIPPAHGLPA